MIPLGFLVAFTLSFAVNYAVPWLSYGKGTAGSEWVWAHEMRGALDVLGLMKTPNPGNYVLAGLVVGIVISGIILGTVLLVPPRVITRARLAGALSLLAIPLYLAMVGGGIGNGVALDIASRGQTEWALSIAGISIIFLCLLGTILLMLRLLRDLPRRGPVQVVGGSLIAAALYHGIPWYTIVPANDSTAINTFAATLRPALDQSSGTNYLALVSTAILVALIAGVVWSLVVAFVPEHEKAAHLIDAAFALVLVIPLMLALPGIGYPLGDGIASMSSTTPGFRASVNGFVFLAIATFAAVFILQTVNESARRLEAIA